MKRGILTIATQLQGVLYYADGYFFQCLEGEDPVLELLVEKLRKDSRHREIMIYGLKAIDQNTFYRMVDEIC